MRVQLNLIRFLTETRYDFLTISSDGTQLARISGTYSNRIYTSIGNTLTLRFTSDRSVTRSGFIATFVEVHPTTMPETTTPESTTQASSCGFNAVATSTSQPITSPNYPKDYPNNADCTWTITASDGMRVQLNLIRFSTETSYDYLTISSDGTQLARNSGIYSNRIYTSIGNTLTLRFTSDRSVTRSGFNATFVEVYPTTTPETTTPESTTQASSCRLNAVATSTSQPITSPNYPGNYPNYADCTWTITASDGMRVQLNLISFLTETSYDYLTISSDGTQLASISGTFSNRIYTSIGNTLTLRFTSDRSATRSGFNATFVEYQHVATTTTSALTCGYNGVATSTSQPITSPNYPNNYPNNADCTWTITASDGMRVQLNLIRLSTERSYDYLTISSDGTQLARISGTYLNRIYTSIGNTLTLRFTSDRSVTRSGFNATFVEVYPTSTPETTTPESTTQASSCGFNAVATSTSQLITSPNYPRNYPNNADCTWTITASDGMRVQLNLIRFSTERSWDYLTISSDDTQLARNSGIYSNRIYSSIGNTLTLRFTSDRSVTRSGFNATFVAIPGVQVTTEPTPTPIEITHAVFQDQTTAKACQDRYTDLMFLLDSSGSLTPGDFQLAANFVKNVITGIDLASFQVGVMQYSHYLSSRELNDQPYITTEINIGEYTEADPFKAAIDNIQPHGYTTYTAHAVLKAIRVDFPNSNRFNDSCTSKIIVVITDGISSDSNMLRAAALEAKNLGITIYAIGVGDANTQELVVLTRPESGTKDKMFQIDQYASLPSILQGLRSKILS
ncbi:scavenger receptor cysteine-rich domain-containing protein DMBT1-like [Ciona intestinalis]